MSCKAAQFAIPTILRHHETAPPQPQALCEQTLFLGMIWCAPPRFSYLLESKNGQEIILPNIGF